MTDILEERPFGLHYTNVYLSILVLFCFKLFVKISLSILTHFYVVQGNRKEAARIAAEFYNFGQGHSKLTLLSQGYNANIITIDHVTPLHEACLRDHVACARALIEAGANVSFRGYLLNFTVSSLIAMPRSLCQLCRLSIQNYMGRSRLHLISHLKLPTLLKSFLHYRQIL
ncbi:ankyrin repeat and SOCS box protein 5-like [Carassius carassius]|uniref:ankyrin repeat and SOCS box protein 5-like n=1 Tax=Carassius carassius TaxID=217509 RepID=UPI00286929CA|nr:ankyrin repeat and SOCS box protein 5-like [Carassius carassius]